MWGFASVSFRSTSVSALPAPALVISIQAGDGAALLQVGFWSMPKGVAQPGLTSLVSGIVQDAQALLRQQLTLFQVEFKNDMRRTAAAPIPLVTGAVIALAAFITLAIGAALLLSTLWPTLVLWGSFAIVGGALAVAALALVLWGKAKFDQFNPLPDQSVQGLKENVQWNTKK